MPTILAADRVRTADGILGDAVLIDRSVVAVGTVSELTQPGFPGSVTLTSIRSGMPRHERVWYSTASPATRSWPA